MNNHTDKQQLNADVAFHLDSVTESGILKYRSDALPTWCPGCGYYGITHGLTQALNELQIENRNLVLISGIGCAGRYPFFVNGYGFHTVHGRGVPVACGVKMANPELTVLAVGGDGDGFGIGGGHLPHGIRRNVDITYIVFDNSIYGLTKGQTSPTTPIGQVSKTTPYGNPDMPLRPVVMGLAYGASFLGLGYAGKPDELKGLFKQAILHRGFSFVVITTPCLTFDHVNITYDRMRDIWEPMPKDHDPGNFESAMALAIDPEYYYGVLYQSNRPSWDDVQADIAVKAKG